jgi:hypothetical protein
MATSNNKAIGTALYLEMRRGSQTVQLLVTPEGITSDDNKYVPLTVYRRQISKSAPRRSWKQFASGFRTERDASGQFVQLDNAHALATVSERIGFLNSLFAQLISAQWKVHKQPIVVEVSSEDLRDVRAGKTPYKILGRVTRCRRTLDFGEALFES